MAKHFWEASAERIFRFRAAWIALFFVLGFAAPLRADPKFELNPGFDGYYRPGQWTPIYVRITNSQESENAEPFTLKGELSVKTKPTAGDETVFVREVTVTHQQSLLVILYAQISSEGSCDIEFRGGRLRRNFDVKQALTELKPSQRLYVELANDATSFAPSSALIAMKSEFHASLTSAEMPDRWQGYESVDLIVLPRDITAYGPSEEQKKALNEWVHYGGRLLAVAGASYQTYAESFLKPILPADFERSMELDLPAGSGTTHVLAADMKVKEGAGVVWAHEGKPIGSRWAVGAGETAVSAIDLTGKAGEIPMAKAFWDSMLFSPGGRMRHSAGDSLTLAGTDFGFGRAARLPPMALVMFLLFLYTAIVGPFNFYVLGKRKRLEFAWVTIPTIVVFFSATIYLIGFWAKGGFMIVRELDVVQTAAGAPGAKLEKTVSMFTPEKRAYNLSVDSPTTLMSSVWQWKYGVGEAETSLVFQRMQGMPLGGSQSSITGAGWPLRVTQTGGASAIENRLMGQWTSQNFQASSTLTLDKGFEGSAKLRKGARAMDVRFVNNSGKTLRDAFLWIGQEAALVGDVAPGQEVAIAVPFSTGGRIEAVAAGGEMTPTISLQQAQGKTFTGVPETYDEKDPEAANVAENLARTLWEKYEKPATGIVAPPRTPLRPRIVGRLDESPARLQVNGDPDSYAYAGFAVIELPMRTEAGPFTISEANSVAEVCGVEVDKFGGGFRFKPDGALELDKGVAYYVVSPGIRDRPTAIRSARLHVAYQGDQAFDVQVSVFNYSTGEWRENIALQVPNRTAALRPGEENPIDGSVAVRIEAERKSSNLGMGGDAALINSVGVTYEGEAQ